MAPRRPKLLSSTRPKAPGARASTRTSTSTTSGPSSASKSVNKAKATRTIIRAHHTLQKRLAAAQAAGDGAAAAGIAAEIERNGGIEAYQRASLLGQNRERGGDSSKLLVQWLKPLSTAVYATNRRIRGLRPPSEKGKAGDGDGVGKPGGDDLVKIRLLEVGALDPHNEITRLPFILPTRIDLHSQHKSIITQDFTKRPLPTSESDRFELISLSLVLNYVPDARTRGDMLRRCAQFLSSTNEEVHKRADRPELGSSEEQRADASILQSTLPLLFFVLPRPCVDNSRYFTESHLKEIMRFLGFTCTEHKLTSKLYYSLWQLTDPSRHSAKPAGNQFSKRELNPGKGRNNFHVILE